MKKIRIHWNERSLPDTYFVGDIGETTYLGEPFMLINEGEKVRWIKAYLIAGFTTEPYDPTAS